MKPLREWPGRRVLALALAWVIGLPFLAAPAVFGAVAWLARTENDRAATPVPDSLAPGLRIDLPAQSSDFFTPVAGSALLGLLLIPPLTLCVAWIVARRRHSVGRT